MGKSKKTFRKIIIIIAFCSQIISLIFMTKGDQETAHGILIIAIFLMVFTNFNRKTWK